MTDQRRDRTTLSPLLHLKVTYGWLLFFLYHLNEKLKKVSEKFGR